MSKSDQKKDIWRESEKRQELFKAAKAAGEVFDRELKEQEEHELRDLARTLRSA